MPVASTAQVSFSVVKRQELPHALEYLLRNQNYTEFFFWEGTRQVTAKLLQGNLKVLFFIYLLTRAFHIRTHVPRPDTQPYAPLCFCRSPQPNTNKGSCTLESVGSLTFTWLLCKHLRELHKFQPRGSVPRRAEPYNSLQLKAESEAIRLARRSAGMDLLFQMVSNLSFQRLSLSGRNPASVCPVLPGAAAPASQGSPCPRALPAEKPALPNPRHSGGTPKVSQPQLHHATKPGRSIVPSG